MAEKSHGGEIVPTHAYTPEQLGKIFGTTARNIRESLIDTGELPTARRGRFIELIMGHVVINWVERNMGTNGNSES